MPRPPASAPPAARGCTRPQAATWAAQLGARPPSLSGKPARLPGAGRAPPLGRDRAVEVVRLPGPAPLLLRPQLRPNGRESPVRPLGRGSRAGAERAERPEEGDARLLPARPGHGRRARPEPPAQRPTGRRGAERFPPNAVFIRNESARPAPAPTRSHHTPAALGEGSARAPRDPAAAAHSKLGIFNNSATFILLCHTAFFFANAWRGIGLVLCPGESPGPSPG